MSSARTPKAARRIFEVAQLRYGDGLSPGEIARRLSITPSSVSRILRRADEEAVQHIVRPPRSRQFSERILRALETTLQQKFDLVATRVVDVDEALFCGHRFICSLDEALHSEIGVGAVPLLERFIKNDMTVGVGGGRAVHALVRELRAQRTLLADRMTVWAFAPGNALYHFEEERRDSVISCNAAAVVLGRTARAGSVHQSSGSAYYHGSADAPAADVDVAVIGLGVIAPGYPHCLRDLRHELELDPKAAFVADELEDIAGRVVRRLKGSKPDATSLSYFPVADLLWRPFVVEAPPWLSNDDMTGDERKRLIELTDDLSNRMPAIDYSTIQHTVLVAGGARKVHALGEILRRATAPSSRWGRQSLVTDVWTAQALLSAGQIVRTPGTDRRSR